MTVNTRTADSEEGAVQTQATQAYEQLRTDIITSSLPAGSKLRIRDLCDRYQFAMSSIREALNRLTRDGLVQLIDLRGFSVSPMSEKDLNELTKTRCWLNEKALRESIINGGSDWEESVVLAYHRLSRTPRLGGENELDLVWENSHRVFHESLISACGSPWMIRFCDQLFDAADRYRLLTCSVKQARKVSHKEIMEAAVARRVDEAAFLLTAHFEETATYGRAALAEQARQPASSSDRASRRAASR